MKSLKYNPDQGFSLIEVVVSLLMIFFFTTCALEMFVLSSIFKKKAVQYTNATSLLQQDMEKIKSAAEQYSFPKTAAAVVGATTLTLDSTNGLTAGNIVVFSNDSHTYTISSISGNSIYLSSGLKIAVPTATSAVNSTSCNLASTDTASASIATGFMNSLSTTATNIGSTSYSIDGNTYYAVTGTPTQVNSKSIYYWLLRNQTVSSNAPYNVLQLKYVVQPGTSTAPTITAKTLGTAYTEIIPYASLQCPSQ